MHQRRGGWLGTLWRDIRYSARTLRGSPAFSVDGAARGCALDRSGHRHPQRRQLAAMAAASRRDGFSFASHRLVRAMARARQRRKLQPRRECRTRTSPTSERGARSITGIAGVQESSSSLSVPGGLPRQTGTAAVTADFFDVLGVRLTAGRGFTPRRRSRLLLARPSSSSARRWRSLHLVRRRERWASRSPSTASRSRSSAWRRRRSAASRTRAGSMRG